MGRSLGNDADGAREPDAAREFHTFVDAHMTDLSRLAFLLSGDRDAADDLAADALLAAWRQWDRVRAADSMIAYVRGIVVNLASSRVRRLVRERSRLVLLRSDARSAVTRGPDTPAVVDVREALNTLPRGQRACVVLRHGLGLSEAETAQVLGVSVGTVKSQTSKGAAQLRRKVSVVEEALADPERGPSPGPRSASPSSTVPSKRPSSKGAPAAAPAPPPSRPTAMMPASSNPTAVMPASSMPTSVIPMNSSAAVRSRRGL